MKKPRARKQPEAADPPLPHPKELRRGVLEAQFGNDVNNEILWDLIGVRFESPPRLERAAGEETPWTPFFASVARAIRAGNADFFREVARLLETRVAHGPERRVDRDVMRAFHYLRARAKWLRQPLPTKREVRTAALRGIAYERVMRRKGRTPLPPLRTLNADWWSRLPPALVREVDAEIDRMPEQDWTRIFKRCGLAALPGDKGGQRAHRKARRAK